MAVYTKSAVGNPVSLEAQQAQCRQWAEQRGAEVVRTYQTTGEDDTLLDLMNDVGRGEFDTVVAMKVVNYTRQAEKLKALIVAADAAGVAVHTVEDPTEVAASESPFFLTMLNSLKDGLAGHAAVTRRDRLRVLREKRQDES
ncbi:recombinase family protein [Streptomyces sp. NPDC004528]|uniref:recombinase family protein n=1 Tax=Streptomyces sp. NPDC004528 TaxID=3154550 RepID=UPI0033B7A84A